MDKLLCKEVKLRYLGVVHTGIIEGHKKIGHHEFTNVRITSPIDATLRIEGKFEVGKVGQFTVLSIKKPKEVDTGHPAF